MKITKIFHYLVGITVLNVACNKDVVINSAKQVNGVIYSSKNHWDKEDPFLIDNIGVSNENSVPFEDKKNNDEKDLEPLGLSSLEEIDMFSRGDKNFHVLKDSKGRKYILTLLDDEIQAKNKLLKSQICTEFGINVPKNMYFYIEKQEQLPKNISYKDNRLLMNFNFIKIQNKKVIAFITEYIDGISIYDLILQKEQEDKGNKEISPFKGIVLKEMQNNFINYLFLGNWGNYHPQDIKVLVFDKVTNKPINNLNSQYSFDENQLLENNTIKLYLYDHLCNDSFLSTDSINAYNSDYLWQKELFCEMNSYCIRDQILKLYKTYDSINNIVDNWAKTISVKTDQVCRTKNHFIKSIDYLSEIFYDVIIPEITINEFDRVHFTDATGRLLRYNNGTLSDSIKQAAGIFIVCKKNKEFWALLGNRVFAKKDCYGNPGGIAERDEALIDTALRETYEELMNLLIIRKSDLKECFSHDLLSFKPGKKGYERYRMYVLPLNKYRYPYISANTFNETLEKYSESSSRENSDFIWVNLKQLVNKVSIGSNSIDNYYGTNGTIDMEVMDCLDSESGYSKKKINLHYPLYCMLRQGPVLGHLLGYMKYENITDNPHTISLLSELDTDGIANTTFIKKLGKKQFGFIEEYRYQVISSKNLSKINYEVQMPISIEDIRETIVNQEIHYSKMMAELKNRFSVNQNNERVKIKKILATTSVKHLMLALEELKIEFETPTSKQDLFKLICAYINAIKGYKEIEFTEKLNFDLIEKIYKILRVEAKHSDKYASLYHGTCGDIKFICDLINGVYEILFCKKNKDNRLNLLRVGLDKFKYETINEFLAYDLFEGLKDSEKKRVDAYQLLSFNPGGLFGDYLPIDDDLTCMALRKLIVCHYRYDEKILDEFLSVLMPNKNTNMILLKTTKDIITGIRKNYLEFIKNKGVLLQIIIEKNKLNDLCLVGPRALSISINHVKEMIKDFPINNVMADFKTNWMDKGKNLGYLEGRLYMNPKDMINSTINCYYSGILDKNKYKQYKEDISIVCENLVRGVLIANELEFMPFKMYKDLYKNMYEKFLGNNTYLECVKPKPKLTEDIYISEVLNYIKKDDLKEFKQIFEKQDEKMFFKTLKLQNENGEISTIQDLLNLNFCEFWPVKIFAYLISKLRDKENCEDELNKIKWFSKIDKNLPTDIAILKYEYELNKTSSSKSIESFIERLSELSKKSELFIDFFDMPNKYHSMSYDNFTKIIKSLCKVNLTNYVKEDYFASIISSFLLSQNQGDIQKFIDLLLSDSKYFPFIDVKSFCKMIGLEKEILYCSKMFFSKYISDIDIENICYRIETQNAGDTNFNDLVQNFHFSKVLLSIIIEGLSNSKIKSNNYIKAKHIVEFDDDGCEIIDKFQILEEDEDVTLEFKRNETSSIQISNKVKKIVSHILSHYKAKNEIAKLKGSVMSIIQKENTDLAEFLFEKCCE